MDNDPFFYYTIARLTAAIALKEHKQKTYIENAYIDNEIIGYFIAINVLKLPSSPNIIKFGSSDGCLNLLKCASIGDFFKTICNKAYERQEKISFVKVGNVPGEEYFVCSDFMYNEIAPLCEKP